MKAVARSVCTGLLCALFSSPLPAAEEDSGTISFRRVLIDPVFRAEGVAVADFNGDGKRDIAAGSVYYAGPNWEMHPILEKPNAFTPDQYSDVFACFSEDLNGDGRPDLITVDIPGKATSWFENPGAAGGPWQRHLGVPVTNNESPLWVDLDADGRRELIFGYSPDPEKPDSPQRRMAISRPGKDPYAPWPIRTFSVAGGPGSRKYYHGLGAGDINGDGRDDVVVYEGWWEAPENKSLPEWTFHQANLGEHCAQMGVYDFDGDGSGDVLSTSAHKFGIWWHEQTPTGWQTHLIAEDVSQLHAVCLADVNGDGLMDFVTGKRWWAHMGRDPGADQPAVVVWYELTRKRGRPAWTRHTIDEASGVGTQFEVTDVGGDGLLDVVTSNKKGVYYFQQVRP